MASEPPQEIYAEYPFPIEGWGPLAPPRALQPGSGKIWSDIRNLIDRDGKLQRRDGIVSAALAAQPDPIITTHGGFASNTIAGEVPVWIYTGISPSASSASSAPGACATEFNHPGGNRIVVVVTTRQAWITQDNGVTWTSIVPTYTTGTVTATNGSDVITGAGGTNWVTRGITGYQMIQIQGDAAWNEICSVDSNTQITLVNNYAGGTGAGKTYAIRRSWRGGTALDRYSLVFATIYNQNLYLAGTFLASANGAEAPAVIKVSDLFTTPVPAYLTAAADLTGSLDFITGLKDISGIQILQDGRVVFSGNETKVYYSSPTDDTLWTAAPAGSTEVVLKPGAIHALGRMNNALTLHYEDGVVLAYPQNNVEFPLAFQGTAAEVGCFSPRTLRLCDGVERYVSIHGVPTLFDGAQSTPFGQELRYELSTQGKREMRSLLHGRWDPDREEYSVYAMLTDRTASWTYCGKTGLWWPGAFASRVGTISERDDRTTRASSVAMVGVASYDTVGAASKDMLWALDEGAVSDGVTFSGWTSGGFLAISGDLDFGYPLENKTLQRVVVWFQGLEATTEAVRCEISRDGGANWTAKDKTVSLSLTRETLVSFWFTETSPGAGNLWRYRLSSQVGDGNTCRMIPTRVVVVALRAGMVEEV